jgi:1A family penicillin-binding protein
VGPVPGERVERGDLPDQLVVAVVSTEDRRFFSHWGVDLRGMARALYVDLAAADVVEGGSTITQQLAKMQLVGNERTFTRKLREVFVAIWLELQLSKDEILTRYLNNVYLGAGAHGVSAAARVYFNKPLSDLTLAESAMLAGLIRAPSEFNPLRNLPAARGRASVVLDAMVDAGAITAEQAEQAKAQPATTKSQPRTARAHTWFADWIAKYEFPRAIGQRTQSMRVRTTLRPDLQQIAEQAVAQVLDSAGGRRNVHQVALIAMRPNGAVLAMVGGRDYDKNQFNRAVDAKRQPGSSFKLFVYFAALREGYSPTSKIDARPIQIRKWKPENYGGRKYGEVSLAQAFANSINTAAVRLAVRVGLPNVVKAARDLGIDSPLSEVPSIALGTSEVSPFELTRAFASVRQGRMRMQPWGITAFGAEEGALRTLTEPAPSGEPIRFQQQLIDLLQGVVVHGTGRAAALAETVAGKTGTSQDYRDAWFIGFTQKLVVGVWVGNDDGSSMKQVTGGTLPAEIWKRFVVKATPLLDKEPPYVAAQSVEQERALEPDQHQPVEVETSTRCNISACSSTYHSFRASDCTYQPYEGSRRLCEIRPERGDLTLGRGRGEGTVANAPEPEKPHSPALDVSPFWRAPPAEAACNYELCSSHFRSFDPSDCTYKPYGGGPRQRCPR